LLVIVAWVIAIAPLGFGLGFCLFPGLALATMWSITPQAIIIESAGPARGLVRSWNLVKGRFWAVMGTWVLAFLITVVAQLIPASIAQAVLLPSVLQIPESGGAVLPTDAYTFVSSIGGGLVSLFVYPYTAAVMTILYYDLRIRKEAFDLERMMAELDRPQSFQSDVDDLPHTPPPPAPPSVPFGLPPPE
jgi:hypothetical protein